MTPMRQRLAPALQAVGRWVRRRPRLAGLVAAALAAVLVLVSIGIAQRPAATTATTAGPTSSASPGTSPGTSSGTSPGASAGSSPGSSPGTSGAAAEPFFGTLVTDPDHAAAEVAVGIRVAMVELDWAAYEPSAGQFDAAYAAEVRDRVDRFTAAGMRVTLALGLGTAPSWVLDLPDGRLVDQDGHTADQVDIIFNSSVRDQVGQYLTRVVADLGVANLWAIRITAGGVEVGYPSGGSYWAFDRNALNGPDLPATMARNPFPDWRPGTTTLSAADVTRWADWYIGALDDTVEWQLQLFDSLGFHGYYQLLTPGSGVRPDGFADAVAHDLPDGLTGVGAVWDRFYGLLPDRDRSRIVAYVSSMADLSGGDDSCEPGDAAVALDSPDADSWSATRWISRVADENHLLKAGENPGWDSPSRLNPHYLDASGSGMLAASVRQLTSCGLQGMYWAHDDKIWDGTLPLTRYADAIRGVHPDGVVEPAGSS